MAIPEHLVADYECLPDAPGVYIYYDKDGSELYVGKSVSLRKRVRQYFDINRPRDLKTLDLVARIHKIAHIECRSEVEAFLTENRLIKDMQPPFNVKAKSDINFPVVEITGEQFPRVNVTRDKTAQGSKFYGPFVNAAWLRVALQVLQRVFKYRTCTLDIKEGDPKNKYYRPCLEYHIGRCKAPCAGLQTAADYKADIERLALFLQGHTAEVEHELEKTMKVAAKERRYEDAAGLRDTLFSMRKLREKGSLTGVTEPGILHIVPREGVLKLQEHLEMDFEPRRIEGIDIAHLQGGETTGSLVCFVDGLPGREQYRRYKIKSVTGVNDFASIGEVVTRRLSRLLEEGRSLPDLLLIDGGLGQLHYASTAMDAVLRDYAAGKIQPPEGKGQDQVRRPFLASLAKKEEIVHTLHHPEGLRIPRRSPGLRLLQYVRDEAHRFARHYHHILRRKNVIE